MKRIFNSLFADKQEVQQILKECYYEEKQQLNLFGKSRHWKIILKNRDWSNIKFLILDGCQIKDSDVKFLVSLNWPKLQTLWLSLNQITNKGIKVLLEKNWPCVKDLRINKSGLNDQAVQLLMSSKNVSRLQKLSIAQVEISQQCLKSLLGLSGVTKNLLQLQISQNSIGSKGAKLLTKVQLNSLQILWLKGCHIQTEGVSYLSKGKWPNLKNLAVANNYICEAAYTKVVTNNWGCMTNMEVRKIDPISVMIFSIVNWPRNFLIALRISNEQLEISAFDILKLKFPEI